MSYKNVISSNAESILINSIPDKDILLKINNGGVEQTPVRVEGSTGNVSLPLLTTNGFVKTINSDGTLVVDTASYITGNSVSGFEIDPVFSNSAAADITSGHISILNNVSGTNTGNQVGDGITITGSGTVEDPFVATTGVSGYSGYSGINGTIGSDGASGYSGYSGINGSAGVSGYSGYSGNSITGASGYSGYSGINGLNGTSGASGYSGYSGINGTNGVSGYSGINGASGYSGISGYSGTTGIGTSGYSGYSGITPSTSDFVPYTGASTNVNLGVRTLTTTGGIYNSSDSTRIYLGASNGQSLYASGGIVYLDSGSAASLVYFNGKVYVSGATTSVQQLQKETSGEFVITHTQSNQDIKIQCNDGGVTTTAIQVNSTEGSVSMPRQSYVRAYMSTASSAIAANTWTKVPYNVKTTDVLTEFSSYRFTAKTAGKYAVCGGAAITAVANQFFGVAVYVNGSSYQVQSQKHYYAGVNAIQASAIVDLAVGGYIEMYAYNGTATTMVVGTGNPTSLTICKVA